MTTGDQLAIQALATLDDSPIGGELSPLGAALLYASREAVLAGGIDPLNVAADVAAEVMSRVPDMVAEIGIAAGVSELAEVAPVVGQIIGFAMNIAEAASAQAEAEEQVNIQKCHEGYVPVPRVGTGLGGEVVPADVLDGTSVGDIFAAAGEAFSFTDWSTGDDYHAVSSPAHVKNAITAAKGIAAVTGSPAHTWGNPSGIPASAMQRLAALRGAIIASRGNSLDGGKALFPIYLDLFSAQIRSGRITKAWCHHVWFLLVGGYKNIGSCTQYERRAIQTFDEMILRWDRTAFPLYGKDKLALQAMIQGVSKPKVSRLQGLKGSDVESLERRGALLSHGLVSLSPTPVSVHASASAMPVAHFRRSLTVHAPTAGHSMSPAEHQRIIDAIIAAAQGEGHPPAGRELHVDSELNANDPMTAMPEYPQYQDVEFDDDDYAVVDQYYARMANDIGGDDYSFYGADCFADQEALESEDDENLDPWGDQFIGVGATRQSQVKHLQPIVKKLAPPRPKVIIPINVPVVRPAPQIPVVPMVNVPVARPAPVQPMQNVVQQLRPTAPAPSPPMPARPQIRPISTAAARALPQQPHFPVQQLAHSPLRQQRPNLQALRHPHMPSPSPTSPVSEGYSEENDAIANDQISDDELEAAYNEYDEGEEQDEQYPEDAASNWGYGYGDFGDEECYPHDGSTYCWDDY